MGGVYDAGTGVDDPGDDEGHDRARLSDWDAGHHEDGIGMKFMMLIS